MENSRKDHQHDIQQSFSNKVHALWQDDREYTQRVMMAIAPVFALCYTIIFFGPIELTAFSYESLAFGFMDVIGIMAVVSIVCFLLIIFTIAILRGKLFNYLLTGMIAITICGYLQGNFLNGELGALTGDAISWQMQKGSMFINMLVWFVLLTIPYLILYFNRSVWKKFMLAASIIICLMQTVALFSIIFNYSSKTAYGSEGSFLSNKDLVTYSKTSNTFVFLLDRMDYDYIEEIMQQNPDFFDQLDGFTSYSNAIAENARTRPAANYMFTNDDRNLFKTPPEEYLENAWDANGHNLLKDLSQADYQVNLYSEISNLFGQAASMGQYVSNISTEKPRVDATHVVEKLLTLSTYRYSPTFMKPFFWTYTDEINQGAFIKDDAQKTVYEVDETKFAKEINQFHLDDQKYFKLYHFNGSHTPYTLDEQGKKSNTTTDAVTQTKGSFHILFEAFAKMKELGIYKDASILIVADHGAPVSDYSPLQKATRIGLFYKPKGSEGTALKQSQAPVSHKNLPATMIRDSGLDYRAYGIPLDEVQEDAAIPRYFYKAVMSEGREKDLYIYEIQGNAADFNNWVMIKQEEIAYPFN